MTIKPMVWQYMRCEHMLFGKTVTAHNSYNIKKFVCKLSFQTCALLSNITTKTPIIRKN